MKLSRLLAASLLLISGVALANWEAFNEYSTDDVKTSVHCKVKDVAVLAKTANACKAIGGEVMMLEKK